MSEALQTVPHDRLTRMLQADGSGHTLLERACRLLFVWERGDLILDDTAIPKPFATARESLAWVFSSQERRPVYGFALVPRVWTDGTLTGEQTGYLILGQVPGAGILLPVQAHSHDRVFRRLVSRNRYWRYPA